MGGKLYWRFLIRGARYCPHSLADWSAPSRDAAWIAPHRNEIGLAKLGNANMPLSAPWAGSDMFTKFWNEFGATCSVCLMSSRLSDTALGIPLSLSAVVPSDSRFSATNFCTSATDLLMSLTA